MFHLIWLIALAGWVGGKIAGGDGFGPGADILLGITAPSWFDGALRTSVSRWKLCTRFSSRSAGQPQSRPL